VYLLAFEVQLFKPSSEVLVTVNGWLYATIREENENTLIKEIPPKSGISLPLQQAGSKHLIFIQKLGSH
jgi:hypothetical protein